MMTDLSKNKVMNNKKILNSLLYNVKSIRMSNGIRQAEIANYLNVSLRTYQRIENAEVDLKISTLINIYDFIDPYRTNLLVRSINEHFSKDKSFHKKVEITNEDLPIKDLITIKEKPLVHNLSEINLIKELLSDNAKTSLSGYWELNLEDGLGYWDPELFILYNTQSGRPLFYHEVRSNIWSEDLAEMDRSLFRLLECDIPFFSIHHVTHSGKLRYKVTARGRKKIIDGKVHFYGVSQAVEIN